MKKQKIILLAKITALDILYVLIFVFSLIFAKYRLKVHLNKLNEFMPGLNSLVPQLQNQNITAVNVASSLIDELNNFANKTIFELILIFLFIYIVYTIVASFKWNLIHQKLNYKSSFVKIFLGTLPVYIFIILTIIFFAFEINLLYTIIPLIIVFFFTIELYYSNLKLKSALKNSIKSIKDNWAYLISAYLLLLIIFSTIVIIFSLILVKIYLGFYSNLTSEIFLFIIMIFLKNSINIFFVKLINKIG